MGFATTKAWAWWALVLACLTGLAMAGDISDTEFSDLIEAVKQGGFTLGEKSQDDSKQILEGILQKSKFPTLVSHFISPVLISFTHPGLVGVLLKIHSKIGSQYYIIITITPYFLSYSLIGTDIIKYDTNLTTNSYIVAE